MLSFPTPNQGFRLHRWYVAGGTQLESLLRLARGITYFQGYHIHNWNALRTLEVVP